jgi:hypothetical protein
MDLNPDNLPKNFDALMRALEAALDSGDERARPLVLEALMTVTLADAEDQARVIRVLERCLLEYPDGDGTPYCLEFWLNRSAATPDLRPRLEALAARQIYRGRSGEWESVSQVVNMANDDPDNAGSGETDPEMRAMRERLLRAMFASSQPFLAGLPDVLVNQFSAGRWTIDVMCEAPDTAWRLMEPGLMRCMYVHDWVAPDVADGIHRRGFEPTEPHLRRFAELVRAGEEPASAARKAMEG